MSHTTTAAAQETRTGRPTSPSADPRRTTPSTTPRVMPLWQAMALLFAPAKSPARP